MTIQVLINLTNNQMPKVLSLSRNRPLNPKKGFTLLEILLVVGIIAILAGIVIVAINPSKQLATVRNAQRKSDIKQLDSAILQYYIDNFRYPAGITSSPLDVCDTGSAASTTEGVTCPEGTVNLSILVPLYITSIPKDPKVATTSFTGYIVSKDSTTQKIGLDAVLAEDQDINIGGIIEVVEEVTLKDNGLSCSLDSECSSDWCSSSTCTAPVVVNSCGNGLSGNTHYILNADLDCSSACTAIEDYGASNSVFDLKGYTITGMGYNDCWGLAMTGATNFVVKNGTVAAFGSPPIGFWNGGNTIQNITVNNPGGWCAMLLGSNNIITNLNCTNSLGVYNSGSNNTFTNYLGDFIPL